MAKFRLKEGEQVIERVNARDPALSPEHCELILTSQRIVVTHTRRSGLASMFGAIGALIGEAFSETRIEYQIARNEFGSAEAIAPKELAVRSTGGNYVLTRFELKLKDAAGWAERLQRWSTGDATEIATATVVTRD